MRSEMRTVCLSKGTGSSLFVSERHHGIDPHGAPRRQVGREQRDGKKQERDADERDAVDGVDSIEHSAQQIRGSERQTHSDNNPASTGRALSRSMRMRTSRFFAPRAMRMPTSRVRRTTI